MLDTDRSQALLANPIGASRGAASRYFAFIVKKKVDPYLNLEINHILPPNASERVLHIASPKPVPV